MDEQPLDRDAIRRLHARNVKGYCMTCEGDETGCDIPALLDLLEQTERDRDIFNEVISRVQAERDEARRECDEANGAWLRVVDERNDLREQVARLTEERDDYAARLKAVNDGSYITMSRAREAAEARVLRLQTVLEALIAMCDQHLDYGRYPEAHIAPEIQAAREALAAVPVVPDRIAETDG